MSKVLCKAALGLFQYGYLFLYMECLGVNLLHMYMYVFKGALQYTTAHLQVLFSSQFLGRITKVFAVITLN